MTVERYSHVMHITSNVTGELEKGCTSLDALRVSLPVGTVSGAPKVRAMQIIDEVEPTRRGPYGGAVGYVDFAGNMDTCIALRTIVWKNGQFDVQAGAGVVADSVPASEYEETMPRPRRCSRRPLRVLDRMLHPVVSVLSLPCAVVRQSSKAAAVRYLHRSGLSHLSPCALFDPSRHHCLIRMAIFTRCQHHRVRREDSR
jgi:hypothetical protein